jgi:integrase
MSARKANADPGKRRRTRYRGISYRLRADGSRFYSIYFQGRYLGVEGGENEALAKQAELRGKAARGEVPVAPTHATFAEVAEQWYESKRYLRPYTRRNYRSYLDRILIPRFGSKRVASMTVEQIAALIRDLEKKRLSPATITDYLKPLNGTLTFAVRRGLLTVNPCSLLTRDDRPRPRERKPDHIWSEREIAALIGAAENLAHQAEARYDYSPLLRTALATGLRLGELLGLTWADIDLQLNELHVRRQWTRLGEYAPPKTRAAVRRIPLSADVAASLARHKLSSRYSKDSDPVFASRLGRPLGHRNATSRGFEPAARAAEIEGVTFHSMRHAFASRMISRGISSIVLAALMGHESSAITERRYIHLFDRQRTDDAVRQAMAFAGVADAS